MKTEAHSPSFVSPEAKPQVRWLIPGGAGFIGCNLIKRLIAEGVPRSRVLDNLSVGTREDLKRVCSFDEALCATEDLRKTKNGLMGGTTKS